MGPAWSLMTDLRRVVIAVLSQSMSVFGLNVWNLVTYSRSPLPAPLGGFYPGNCREYHYMHDSTVAFLYFIAQKAR